MQCFSLGNVFWYHIGYGMLTFLVMRFMPLEKRKKILTRAGEGTFTEKISALVSRISRWGIMAVSFFVPFCSNLFMVIIGNLLYFVGLILATVAMWQFSKAETNRPITKGIYRISRNPMQVMCFVMYIGIAVAAGNIILSVLTLINIVTSYPMFFIQERYCLEKYGKEYQVYMQKTPRILLIRPNSWN